MKRVYTTEKSKIGKIFSFLLVLCLLACLLFSMPISVTAEKAEESQTDDFMVHITQYRSILRQADSTEIPLTVSLTARTGNYDGAKSEHFDFTFIQGVGSLGSATLPSYTSEVFLDGGVESLGSKSLVGFTELRDIFIPDTVTAIADDAFAADVKPAVYGFDGSTAQSFAEEKGWTFIPVADIRGDVNMDLSVDMRDLYLLRVAAANIWVGYNGEWARPAAGDLDGDDAITMKDVLVLRRYIAGLIDTLG